MFTILLIVSYCVTAFPGLAQAPAAPPVAAPPAVQEDTSRLSDKDLFKRAEANRNAGRTQEAYEQLRVAFAKRGNKPDKKYTPMYVDLAKQLGGGLVAKAREEFAANRLEQCETFLQASKRYFEDPAIADQVRSTDFKALESDLASRIVSLNAQFKSATTLAAELKFDEAVKVLESLYLYQKYVPDIGGRIRQVRAAQVSEAIGRGWKLCEARDWQPAEESFRQALRIEPNHEQAKAGLGRVKIGIEADKLAGTAQEKLTKKDFVGAMRAIDLAIETDKEPLQFKQLRQQIHTAWVESLNAALPSLIDDRSSFQKTRDAALAIETLRTLQPDNPLAQQEGVEAGKALGRTSWSRGEEFYERADKSRAATAYALLVNAERLLGQNDVKPGQVKDAVGLFNRKRGCQIVMSTENASEASDSFVSSVQTRAENTVRSLNMPDLRIRNRKDYLASPREDLAFIDTKPNGMSFTAELSMEVRTYRSDLTTKETSVKSKFLVETTQVINPAYEEMRKKTEQRVADIESGREKVKKDMQRSVTQELWDRLKNVPQYIPQRVTRDYEYRKIEHTRSTSIEVLVVLRDRYKGTPFAQETIQKSATVVATETTGVHDKDEQGVVNHAPRLTTREEALNEVGRLVRDELAAILPRMLPPYLNRFWTEGRRQYSAGQLEDAVENLLCHWAFVRAALPREDGEFIEDVVRRETGFDLKSFKDRFFAQVEPPPESLNTDVVRAAPGPQNP